MGFYLNKENLENPILILNFSLLTAEVR